MKNVLLIAFFLLGCSKSETINVTAIFYTDASNQAMGYTGDTSNQWKSTEFSSTEMSLFKSLDTAKLSTSSVPTISNTGRAFPNPAPYLFEISPLASQSYSGMVTVKLILVNSQFEVKTKLTAKTAFNSGNSTGFKVDVSTLSAGFYRAYVTYSVSGHDHFVKFWGNIQKNK